VPIRLHFHTWGLHKPCIKTTCCICNFSQDSSIVQTHLIYSMNKLNCRLPMHWQQSACHFYVYCYATTANNFKIKFSAVYVSVDMGGLGLVTVRLLYASYPSISCNSRLEKETLLLLCDLVNERKPPLVAFHSQSLYSNTVKRWNVPPDWTTASILINHSFQHAQDYRDCQKPTYQRDQSGHSWLIII